MDEKPTDEKSERVVPDYEPSPKLRAGPSWISRAMARLTRPMPMGYYLLMACLLPIVAKLIIVLVAVFIHMFQ